MYHKDTGRFTQATYDYFAKRYGINTTVTAKLPRAIWEYESCQFNVVDGLYFNFDESKYDVKEDTVNRSPSNDDMFDEAAVDSILKTYTKRLPTSVYTFTRIMKKKEMLYNTERDKKIANGRYFDMGQPRVTTVRVYERKNSA